MKKKTKLLVGSGIFCILFLLSSVWYAVTFNGSRLVAPMDFSSYTFQIRDLPMLLSVSLFCIYVLVLFVSLAVHGSRRARVDRQRGCTRTIDPKLGLLGFLGFLGFAGFWTYQLDKSVFPFLFFIFFGFFGFYFEGKMSGTLMDERFRENAARAQLASSRVSLSLIFLSLILLCQGKLLGSLEYTLIAVLILLSLALALWSFLSSYLLYRYDHDEQDLDDGA